MILRRIRRTIIEQRPFEAWNAFVSLIATGHYGDLSDVQRVAHLCFWYDSEVRDGGQLQYFENRRGILLNETLAALQIIDAACQREVFENACRLYSRKPRNRIESVGDYMAIALRSEFAPFDSAYNGCIPAIQDL